MKERNRKDVSEKQLVINLQHHVLLNEAHWLLVQHRACSKWRRVEDFYVNSIPRRHRQDRALKQTKSPFRFNSRTTFSQSICNRFYNQRTGIDVADNDQRNMNLFLSHCEVASFGLFLILRWTGRRSRRDDNLRL